MGWFCRRKCFGCGSPSKGTSPAGATSPAFLTCSRCKGAEYCSVDCQKKDFISHRNRCKKLGSLLAELQAMFLNDDVKEFVMKGKSGMTIWNQLTDEAKQDHLVHLVRHIQSIVGAYIQLAHTKESKFPVEKCLEWLLRCLKIVAYHTEQFPTCYNKMEENEEDDDEENKENRKKNNIEKKILRFGGDWDDGRKGAQVKHGNCSSSGSRRGFGMMDTKYNCDYFARRRVRMENSPRGQADPFFCFGGRFNIPDVYILMGKHQEAFDYIYHWTDKKFWESPRAEGDIIKHHTQWVEKRYVRRSMFKSFYINTDLFEGECESVVALRLNGALMLIRVYATTNYDKMKEERNKAYQAFLLGTHSRVGENSPISILAGFRIPLMLIHKHVVNNPCESEEQQEEYNYDILDQGIQMSGNAMYYMTGGDERFKSRMSQMGLSCAEDADREAERLVWHLFHKLSQDEMVALVEAYGRFRSDNYF